MGFGRLDLNFESATALFTELTPARIDLLEALRQCGPCSVYALSKPVASNYSNVHTDTGKLEQHGLIGKIRHFSGVISASNGLFMCAISYLLSSSQMLQDCALAMAISDFFMTSSC